MEATHIIEACRIPHLFQTLSADVADPFRIALVAAQRDAPVVADIGLTAYVAARRSCRIRGAVLEWRLKRVVLHRVCETVGPRLSEGAQLFWRLVRHNH